MELFVDPKVRLEKEFMLRRQKNPQYSMRAFAKLVELPPGRLSQLLSEKRRLTEKTGRRIALRLGYNPQKTERFIAEIRQAKNPKKEIPAKLKLQQIDMDQFELIADPIHFALLSLLETDNFSSEPKWISRRLNVSVVEARQAIDRLVRVGLIGVNQEKIFLTGNPGLTTTHDIRSSALRKSHKKIMEESISALEEIELELRDITSMTMAIDPEKIGEAKVKIKEFRHSLCSFLEHGKKTEVYRLSIQLLPVTKKENRS